MQDVARQQQLPHLQLISDTIFAGVEADKNGLKRLLKFARHLLESGIGKNFPIRGAITHGEITWQGAATYGPALVTAYELAIGQNWLGVTCQHKLPDIEELWGFETAVCYPPPLKFGNVVLYAVVPWTIPHLDILIGNLSGGGLVTAPQTGIPWDEADKIQNTIIFSQYLQQAQKLGHDPRMFRGYLPIHLADLTQRGDPKGLLTK